MSVISFSRVFFAYPTVDVLADVSFTCSAGERLCVVGPNGSGKSTLLQLAARNLRPVSGLVTSPVSPPRPMPTPRTVGDVLDAACSEILALRERFDDIAGRLGESDSDKHAAEYDELLASLDLLGAWELEARQAQMLAGVGLSRISRTRRLTTLSPGQRGRLRLAATLIGKPPALVLDEPTNHLDDPARDFLTETVMGWDGPVLFASHDRDFIERTASGILDLDTAAWRALATASGATYNAGIHRCHGKYSDYLREKAAARAEHISIHAQQGRTKRSLQQHRRDSEVVGHRNSKPRSEVRSSKKYYADRAQAVSTRRINDDSRRLAELAETEVRKPRYEFIQIELPEPGRASPGIAISVRGAAVADRLRPTSFELAAGEHLMITGANGTGKSTLLRWLHTLRPPTHTAAGEVWAEPSVLMPQELPILGDDLVSSGIGENGIGEAGKGFLHPRYWAVPVAELSDGNQRRVQLALAAARQPGLLLIDEPTNYLDLDSIESLERAFFAWAGTLVIATHDQWLIKKWLQTPGCGEPRRHHVHLEGGGFGGRAAFNQCR